MIKLLTITLLLFTTTFVSGVETFFVGVRYFTDFNSLITINIFGHKGVLIAGLIERTDFELDDTQINNLKDLVRQVKAVESSKKGKSIEMQWILEGKKGLATESAYEMSDLQGQISRFLKITKAPIDPKSAIKIIAKEVIKSEFIWKKINWSNKEKEIVTCEVCYSSPEPGYASPWMEIFKNDDNKYYFSSKLVESTWVQDGKYTVSFSISKDLLGKVKVSIESKDVDNFVEVRLLDILDKKL